MWTMNKEGPSLLEHRRGEEWIREVGDEVRGQVVSHDRDAWAIEQSLSLDCILQGKGNPWRALSPWECCNLIGFFRRSV